MRCEGDANAVVGDRRDVVVVNAWHMGSTRGSDIVSSASYVLWMREDGRVYEMCMCLARRSVVGEWGDWMIGLGLGFTNPVETEGVFDVCLCMGCGSMGGVGGEWLVGLAQGLEVWWGGMSV